MSTTRHVTAFALYLLLATALTWPFATHLDTFVGDRGDPLLNCWIIDWGCYALTHAPLHLFDAPVFHPAKYPLAFSEHMAGIDLFVLPFHIAGAKPLAVYNLAMILGFAFSGYGAWVLARMISGNSIAAFAGGIFAAFVTFKFDHLSHVQVVWTGWLPLLLAALLAYWRHADLPHAILLGAAFVMNGLTNIYWLAFGTTALGITIAFLCIVSEKRDAVFWRRLIVTLVISGALLLPFLIPYEIVSKTYRMWRRSYESLAGSATLYDFLMPSNTSLLYGWIGEGRSHVERHLFLGVVPLLLAACSVWRRQSCRRKDDAGRIAGATQKNHLWLDIPIALLLITAVVMIPTHGADVPITLALVLAVIRFAPNIRDLVSHSRFTTEEWVAALWIAIGFIGALGEHAFLHPFLFRLLPIFRATRTPARWVVILHTGLAVWMAIGFVELLARVRLRTVVALAVVALTIVDVLPRIAWATVPAERPPVYQWIARNRPSVFVELPVGVGEMEAQYMLAATTHHVPMMNGVSGFETSLHKRLVDLCNGGKYDDAFYLLLTSNGCKVVVVHNALLGDTASAMNAWLVSEVRRGKLAPIAHFGGDDVYAITR